MQEKTSHPTNIEGVDRRASQDEVIGAALAAGRSYDEAAAAANVSARTVRRRMADDRFAAEVRTLRAERASRLSARLLELGHDAIGVLARAMEDEQAGIQLRAAQTALTLGQRYRREVEMAERLAAVEHRLDLALGVGPSTPEGEDDEIA